MVWFYKLNYNLKFYNFLHVHVQEKNLLLKLINY
jgi:hypothetical protein